MYGAYATVLRSHGLDSFNALLNVEGDTDLSKRGLDAWRERSILTLGPHVLYLKRYRNPPLRSQLVWRIRGFASTAEAEWYWIGQLRGLGLSAPRPVACGWRCRRGLEQASLLLVARVEGESLEQVVRREADGPLGDRAFLLQVARRLARDVATLHGAGLFHRDLYLAHVFLRTSAEGEPGLTFIDLQRVIRAVLGRKRRWVVKDLASLNYSTPLAAASTADRVRWYKWYRGSGKLTARDKKLIRAIAAKSKRIARHSRKHGLG